jgi:hypothetical protein
MYFYFGTAAAATGVSVKIGVGRLSMSPKRKHPGRLL